MRSSIGGVGVGILRRGQLEFCCDVLAGGDETGGRGHVCNSLGISDDHLGEEALSIIGDEVQIKVDKALTDVEGLPFFE